MATNELNKRNNEYIYKLSKIITAEDSGINKETVDNVLKNTKNQLLDAQKKGITATQLFGTVNQYVLDIKDPKGAATRKEKLKNVGKKSTNSKNTANSRTTKHLFEFDFKTEFFDTAGLLFIMFAFMYGITSIMNPKNATSMGIVSLISIAVLSGLVYVFSIRYITPNPKVLESKKPAWKKILAVIGLIASWMILFTLVAMVPKQFNPELPNGFLFVLAIIGLLVYLYWRKSTKLPKGFLVIGILAANASNLYKQNYEKGKK
ncbi:MAG: DUF1129 domain-containing protein [Lactobacillaceae bacterium]|jgi:uncharacterized membrane-anchored protein|nr:DUF1129 domain-containing protein [Lactobacillaceae bacterium]